MGRPRPLGTERLLPGMTAFLTHDGRWQLFAARVASLGPARRDNRREIVVTEQRAPDGPFGAWSTLGNPEADADRGRRVGSPVVTRDGAGWPVLFARNWAMGVSMRRQRPDGQWTPWRDLGGAEVQEGLSALTDHEGRIHVVACGHDAVHHWSQREPGGPFTVAQASLPAPADPPAAVLRPDGGIALAYREARTSRIVAGSLAPGARDWRPERLDLPARGYGPLALLAQDDAILLAARNDEGTTSTALWRSGTQARWSTDPGRVAGVQALVADAAGHPVLAHLTSEATLRTAPVSTSSAR